MNEEYALDKLILEEKKLSDLTPKELVDLIHDGKLTNEMFMEVQREYLNRVGDKKEVFVNPYKELAVAPVFINKDDKEAPTINGFKPLGNRKTIDVRGYPIELIEICHDSIKNLFHPLTKIILWWSKDEMAYRIEAEREGFVVKSVNAYEMLSLEAKEMSTCLEQKIHKEEKGEE